MVNQTESTQSDDDALIGALLAELDDPPRTADQPRFLHRARRGWARRAMRIAGAAATVAVAAAAMVPTSPVHRLIFGAAGAARPTPATAASSSGPTAPPGIAVPPSPSLTVVLQHEQPHGAIEITWTVTGEVSFRSRGGTTAYRVASGQVSIDNQEPADEFRIDIPPAVQQLRIRAGSRVLLRWPEDSARYVRAGRPAHLHIPLDGGTGHEP